MRRFILMSVFLKIFVIYVVSHSNESKGIAFICGFTQLLA